MKLTRRGLIKGLLRLPIVAALGVPATEPEPVVSTDIEGEDTLVFSQNWPAINTFTIANVVDIEWVSYHVVASGGTASTVLFTGQSRPGT